MDIVNANYEFVYCSVGTNGRVSDGGVINQTRFYGKQINNELNIPEPSQLSNSSQVLEYVFVVCNASRSHQTLQLRLAK